MRILHMPQVCSGVPFSFLILMAGCSSPSSQTLDSLTVTATPSTVAVGGASILKAVAHLSDGTTQDVTTGTTWTLSDPDLATMSNGALSAKAVGTVTVQAAYVEATPAGSSPASAVVSPANLSASTQVTITASNSPTADNVPAITWAAPAAISYGTALGSTQLNATANVAGTFAYTPAAGTVLKAGKQTLSATFTPSNSQTYSAATASVQLTVNQATPPITWATPTPIAAGTALSATQLDATASVPGSFIYNPAAGTVLAAGTQQLTAVFSPTDVTDYSSTTTHASLTITSPSNPPSNPAPGPAPPGNPANAAVCTTLPANPSATTVQNALTSCGKSGGGIVQLSAGVTSTTTGFTLPCGVVIQGLTTTPATAEFTTSTTGLAMFYSMGGCASSNETGIQYLQINGTGPWSIDASSYQNLVFNHNQVTSMPYQPSCNGSCSSLWLQGNVSDTKQNITIEYNTFGDNNSCVASESIDDGGCAGILFNSIGFITNLTIKYNSFYHVNEGMHFSNVGFNSQPGGINGTCNNCVIEYNYFNQIARIDLEDQVSVVGGPTLIEYNVFANPSPNITYANMAISAACCFSGRVDTQQSTAVPTDFLSNNVIYNNPATSGPTPIGIEEFGAPQATNNLIQGGVCVGVAYSTTYGNSAISNSTIQGSYIASGAQCIFGPGGPWGPENGVAPPAVISGNVTGATPASVTSVAPTISPSSSSQTFPLTVTLTDPGYTNTTTPVPQGNTGIWYTTDGSTPVPGSGTAQYLSTGGTFTLSSAATVRAVGMWGTPPQPTSYPAGYGFVPSGVVTAAYSVSGGIKRPAGTASSSNSPTGKLSTAVDPAAELPAGAAGAALESVAINPSQPVVAIGSTTQLKAIVTFDDGSVKDVTADFGWQSSDGRIMTANGSGTLAGVASGKATISGSYRGLQASVSANSTIGEVVWSDPIVITEGGTYSGNWQSTDARTPAVTVATTAPVIIENAHIRSLGGLIKTTVAGSDLIVRNSLGVAVNAAVKGQPNGIFLEVSSPVRLDVENNYIENAEGGVIVHGYTGNRDGEQTIVIRGNRARNMNGLLSDGNGGYLPGEGANRSQARFIQFDSVQSVPGIDVGWNEVINYPGRSLVEDNIEVYRSGGTPNQPLEIHDTYIQGAYPYKAAQDAYTGGGIKTDAKPGDNAQEVPAFNSIHDNQVVGTVNYGIQFAAGHDNVAANDRVISSGLLGDGTRIAAQHVGMANADASGAAVSSSMYNNTMRDNLIGWTCWQASCEPEGYRQDQYFPASPADYSTNSVLTAGQITLDMENNEYQVWVNKMATAGIAVGPSF